jgi:hypothetical protein
MTANAVVFGISGKHDAGGALLQSVRTKNDEPAEKKIKVSSKRISP